MERLKAEILAFGGVTWASHGDPEQVAGEPSYRHPGWVKFAVAKDELGWRLIEFLAWVICDMQRAGERVRFILDAPPPYLNQPGECLSFVVELQPGEGDSASQITKVTEFVTWCRREHWEECMP